MSGPIATSGRRISAVVRRLLPLLLLLPLAYAVRPLFWTPLDNRFYDLFLAGWHGAPWRHVVVVGIDRATRSEVLPSPVNPVSRHASQHAEVIRRLDAAGARAIVIDLTLSTDETAGADSALAASMKASGKVHLIAYLEEEIRLSPSGDRTQLVRVRQPAPHLRDASRGAFLADVTLDGDSVLRRYAADPRAAQLGVQSLPERMAGVTVTRPVPVMFPSIDSPLLAVSYGAVLRGDRDALARVKDRIAFVGQVEDPLGDFVATPTLQLLGGDQVARGLPGVAVLAAITETLMQGRPLRDAPWALALGWNVFWCALVVVLLPRERPWLALATVAAALACALVATGLLQARLGLILPAGLLFGCLLASGGHAVIASHVETAKRLHTEEVERLRVQREMETARRTQEQLLPQALPRPPGWEIWGVNVSSLEVSGDYYDAFTGDARGLIWLVIADVSGKGLPAALIMANLHAGLHGRIRGGADDPGGIATDLGRFLYEHTAPESFVTCLLASLDPKTGRLRYACAGHEAPLLLTATGVWRDFETAGPPLGVLPDLVYETSEMQLRAGDRLCLYTDGITEAFAESEEMFGSDRLREVFASRAAESAQELGETILGSVRKFRGRAPQSDDITLVVVRALIVGDHGS